MKILCILDLLLPNSKSIRKTLKINLTLYSWTLGWVIKQKSQFWFICFVGRILYFHCFLCLGLKIAPNSCFWLPCWILASGSVFMQGKSTIKCPIPILCQWLLWELIKWYNDLENGPHDELNNHTLTFLINYDELELDGHD